MKVLSLFDGLSCGAIAFREMGITVERYVAYEIDKYAITVSKHNFPEIEQCGDVFSADFTQYEGFDAVIGGSPCTYWSIAQKNNRETEASGLGWELFSQYVRAVREAKPTFFLYENNKSMSKEIRASIDYCMEMKRKMLIIHRPAEAAKWDYKLKEYDKEYSAALLKKVYVPEIEGNEKSF